MAENEKLDLILAEIQGMKTDIQDIQQKVTRTERTVENEIRVNIRRAAKGHLDLSGKLNECIRISNDIKDKQEIQDIYITMHNNRLEALQ